MADLDMKAQLEARKQNLSRKANQPLQTTPETEQKVSESVETALRSIEQRKARLRDLQSRITQLQNEYKNEAILLAQEEEIIRRFHETKNRNERRSNSSNNIAGDGDGNDLNVQNNNNNNNNNNSTFDNESKVATNTQSANDNNNNEQKNVEQRKKQENIDEELALHLQRQFDNEDNNEETSNQQQIPSQPQPQQQQQQQQPQQQQPQQRSGGRTVYSYSYGTGPDNMITISSNHGNFDDENVDPFSLLSQFQDTHTNSDDDNAFFNSPFARSFSRQSRGPFSSSFVRSNSRNQDPLERIFGMPLLRVGGMGMPFVDVDNLDHDQLLTLFPNVPRGASEDVIQSLPENRYVAPPKKDDQNNNNNNVNNNNNSSNTNNTTGNKKEKNSDESCCICLESFKNGDSIRRLPCLHMFHKDEIDTWLRRNHICPICRIPVDAEPQQPQ